MSDVSSGYELAARAGLSGAGLQASGIAGCSGCRHPQIHLLEGCLYLLMASARSWAASEASARTVDNAQRRASMHSNWSHAVCVVAGTGP